MKAELNTKYGFVTLVPENEQEAEEALTFTQVHSTRARVNVAGLPAADPFPAAHV